MEQKSSQAAAPEELEAKPEQPEKTDAELELEELDKVSGGMNFAAPVLAAPSPAVGVYQIEAITPAGEAEQVPAVPGVFRIVPI